MTLGVGATTESVVLRARPASWLNAAIDVAGQPCASGWVELLGPVSLVGHADSAGVVAVRGIPMGEYGVTVICPGSLPIREQLAIEADGAHRRWTLKSGVPVRGRPWSASGLPLGFAQVLVQAVSVPGSRDAIHSSNCTTTSSVTDW